VAAACFSLLGSASCRSGGDGDGSASKAEGDGEAEAGKDGEKVIKGRFANAVQVSEHGFILEDKPPPSKEELEGDDLSLDGDDDTAMRGGGGSGRKRFGQSPLYVDGKAIAVVAYGELPAWLPTRPEKLSDGRMVNRFRLAEYLEALSVPVAKIREIHFYGGRGRIAIMPGEELRRAKSRLLFSFTEGDAGKMRMHWEGDLEVSDTIDKVQAVAVYIDKKPPPWDRAKWGLVDEHGEKIRGIPYVETPLRGGVRLYLDGRIVHVLKRNRTFERKTAPNRIVDGVPYFRMFEYLEEEGVDVDSIVAVELLDQNTIGERIDGQTLARERDTIELSAPPKSSGHVLIHLGPENARRSVKITALNMYTAARALAHHRR